MRSRRRSSSSDRALRPWMIVGGLFLLLVLLGLLALPFRKAPAAAESTAPTRKPIAVPHPSWSYSPSRRNGTIETIAIARYCRFR